ncbi:MAG TPA: SLATT domain-containing protein [Anaerolineales bacterium]|nr:SLATT domain-containing protein [Anaerolineales bacterium]
MEIETETPKPAPILEIAWTRYANLDLAADRRTKAFYDIRKWITWLGVLATLFAIMTQLYFPTLDVSPEPFFGYYVLSLVVKVFFIAIPVLASIFAAFATKFYSNGAWLIYRAGGEEIKKEIYFYRTILQKDKNRRAYLEKRLGEIQRGLFRSLSGEFAFEGYSGPLPSNYRPGDPNSDPGFHDLNGEEYFKYRLEHQLDWHNRKVNQRKMERRWMTIFVLAIGGLGSVLAALGGPFAVWVAFTASIVAALLGWQELRNVDEIIKNYSKVVMELTILYDHWQNLEPEERTPAEFYTMVNECEKVLWAQNREYIRSMQEALEESGLEKEASLIEGVIKESVASAERTQQAMREEAVAFTKETLQRTEEQVQETFQAALGSLAEEASSEVVQKELEAMGNAAKELVQTATERFSTLSAQLAHLAREYANVDIGRHTSKEELNAILSRYPKSSDVKG